MSGHSKWAQIKHKKAFSDAKKGEVFEKISRQIAIAARQGGADPTMNPRLRLAIELAQQANMPKENIERAIERAAGKGGEASLEELWLEAYGPAGTAIIIKAITNNHNRTLAEIRHILSEHQGKLASEGAVRWLFELVGGIVLENADEEKLTLSAIDLGAKDIKKETTEGKENFVVLTEPENLEKIKTDLQKMGFSVTTAGLEFVAKDYLAPDAKTKEGLKRLFEDLDDQDDVQEIYSNVRL
jgi:YebC/PmpR family DNA-binding regulatory protein